MTFLPIVHRELRIASRKRGTYISRAVVAGIVVLLWLFISGAFLDLLLIQYAKLTLTQNLRTLAAGEELALPTEFGATAVPEEAPVT